jgi:hypothetical protein
MTTGSGASGYVPNPTQAPIIADFVMGTRTILVCGGERSGKSMTAAAAALIDMGPRGTRGKREPMRRYWIIGPDYRQARPEFQYIFDALQKGGLIESYSMPQADTQPWSLTTKWNTIIETRSSGDVMRIASFTVHGIIIAEAAQQIEEVLRRSRGRVAETRGFILLVGTLEEALPWYEDLLRRWGTPNPEGAKSFSLPMWSNIDVFPRGRNDPEIRRLTDSLPADYVARRYGAVAVRHANLVVPEFDFRSHVRNIKPEPEVPVELAIDPGKNAYAVLFVQHVGSFTRVLDCVYTRGEIAQVVIPKVMAHPLWNLVNKEPATSVIDIAGTQEQANKSQVTLWREIAGITLVGEYHKEMDTINAVRFRMRLDPILGEPLVTFSDKMRTGVATDGTATEMLSEFDLWRWGKNTPTGDEKARPIDNNNHAIKALGYKLLHKYGNYVQAKDRNNLFGVQRRSWTPGSARL